MYSIGEFSSVSGIPVRTLRYYHEEGLLVPAAVDQQTKYRTYDERNLEVARVIVALRELEFSLDDIREIVADLGAADPLDFLERQKKSIEKKLGHYKNLIVRIDHLIRAERQAREKSEMNVATFAVEIRDLESVHVAGIRMVGRYNECGQGFATLFRRLGRGAAGKPMCLFFDGEYRAEDANFEPCVAVRGSGEIEGIELHALPGGRCLSLMHRGPYEELSRSYARLWQYMKQHGYEIELPSREVYHRGPGMLFRGNPQKYLTEIQFPIAS